MDLRGRLTDRQIEQACAVLDYQPFIISDDIQTGAAYSWATGDFSDRSFLFRRSEHTAAEWDRFTYTTGLQRRMYDGFVAAIAEKYPNGSLLDVACNNGYFPVKASLLGMKDCWGIDAGAHYGKSIGFLNEVLGTDVVFREGRYDPKTPFQPGRKFDVVCASAIACHLPDPMNFLAYLGSLAKEAIFFFDQVIDTDALLVAYWKPQEGFSEIGQFPYRFNSATRLSRGLLYHGFEDMGFRNIIEIPYQLEYVTKGIARQFAMPDDLPARHYVKWKLGAELLPGGSIHMGILACRS
jgi:SAM-dependent methyltransferase